MISASLEGRVPYMTYPEPWRGQPKQPPEFLRPAPKPSLPPTRYTAATTIPFHVSTSTNDDAFSSRYNGIATSSSSSSARIPRPPLTKYSTPPPPPPAPVNLTKDDLSDDLTSAYQFRLFQAAPAHFAHFPHSFNALYHHPTAHHYPHPLGRPSFAPASPIEPYSPPVSTTTANNSTTTTTTFLSPNTFSPPSPIKRTATNHVAFKVPSGKEGSLKHRILTRPEEGRAPLDLQKQQADVVVVVPRKRFNNSAMSPPPRSPLKISNNNNNNNNSTILENFAKGSLIQLTNGELRKIEDMRTEDFVSSAESSAELRLADSTVVRIDDNYATGRATITLTYNQRRTQVNVEVTMEHPFFVYGQGWASCYPEKTQQCYKLKVHRLQVGDILISLTPREQFGINNNNNNAMTSLPRGAATSTIMTTATSTAMTIRQQMTTSTSDSIPKTYHPHHHHLHHQNQHEPLSLANSSSNNVGCSQVQPMNLHHTTKMYTMEERKRRWSAPDQIGDGDEYYAKRIKCEEGRLVN